jgi:CheY-like chemotaxis protein
MIARPLRILCVEEDPIQRKLMEACLEVMGAEALVVPRPMDAVWVFRKQSVDLVFLDIDMHVAHGLSAFEAIRATPVRGSNVPILAVTENECRWTPADYRQAGFAGLFLKPIEPTRLRLAIEDALKSWNPPNPRALETGTRPSRHFGHAKH